VSLFSLRAQALNPTFQADANIARICARLDGLPLAVELAAARSKVLTPAQILDRLGRRLELLRGGARDAPERQRALRQTIEWSYDLLNEDEQAAFARLSVFAGSFSLEAAEDVVGVDIEGIASLTDKSLLRPTAEGRFFMLETLREFASEQLAALGEAAHFSARQAEWVLALAEQAEPHLVGSDQTTWLDLLEPERDNLRTAATTFAELRRESDALRLATAVWRFWWSRGPAAEGRQIVATALDSAPAAPAADRLTALGALGAFAHARGAWQEAAAFHARALDLARRVDDPRSQALALLGLGAAASAQHDVVAARGYVEEAVKLAPRANDRRAAAIATATLGTLALHDGDYALARRLFEQSLLGFEGEEFATVVNLENLALTALRLGEIEEAARRITESVRLGTRLHDHLSTAHALQVLAAVAHARGQPGLAARVLGAGARLLEEEALSLQELEAELHEETEASVRDDLGDEQFSAEFDGGKAAELPDVVETALSQLAER
jgi:tetratricopeptide (TPR) repeat protein